MHTKADWVAELVQASPFATTIVPFSYIISAAIAKTEMNIENVFPVLENAYYTKHSSASTSWMLQLDAFVFKMKVLKVFDVKQYVHCLCSKSTLSDYVKSKYNTNYFGFSFLNTIYNGMERYDHENIFLFSKIVAVAKYTFSMECCSITLIIMLLITSSYIRCLNI